MKGYNADIHAYISIQLIKYFILEMYKTQVFGRFRFMIDVDEKMMVVIILIL